METPRCFPSHGGTLLPSRTLQGHCCVQGQQRGQVRARRVAQQHHSAGIAWAPALRKSLGKSPEKLEKTWETNL